MTQMTTGPHRSKRAHLELQLDSSPTLGAAVSFGEPADGAASRIVMVSGVPVSRVSPPVVELLSAMDGQSAVRDLHARFAADVPEQDFLALVNRFRSNGLMEGADHKPAGRFVYRAPLTLQVATLRAPAMFAWLDRGIRPLSSRATRALVPAIVLLGVIAMGLQTTDVARLLASPVPLLGLVVVLIVQSVMTLLHEGAHGVTLTRFGGTPRRAGFMLFYLTPAFFVDVTDGWRLEDRWQRVGVALAGPTVHAVLGSAFTIAALFVADGIGRQILLLLGASCFGIVLVNLIPFVRFDGYIALMSALDEPNLRDRSKRDFTRWLTGVLYGTAPVPKRLDRWWSASFGMASTLAPVVLVVFAIMRIQSALASGGPVLAFLVLAIEGAVLAMGVAILLRGVRNAWRAGVSTWRFIAVNLLVVIAVVMAGLCISVPSTTTAGFSATGSEIVLVQGGTRADADIPDGADVALLTNGILVNVPVGEATLAARETAPTSVPLDVLFPVTAGGAEVPATVIGIAQRSLETAGLPSTGQARIELGITNLWQAVWESAVARPLAEIFNQHSDVRQG
ncbi:daptide biosynthesis intramembrane metalloprotease [Microbacterium lacticum]|uniref:daptide biosynthesis intramembrane metalloprotease n=1 Tax=Microbacterium lacticum TaxID=33885 RepID=UPI001F59B61C|nr:daptide biosynthesis intramembrane metalloprotease [Microbacterium lacticum]